MSEKTVGSDTDLPEFTEIVARSSKRRNAIFINKEEHSKLMKLIDED